MFPQYSLIDDTGDNFLNQPILSDNNSSWQSSAEPESIHVVHRAAQPNRKVDLRLFHELHDFVSTFRVISTDADNLHSQSAELVLNGCKVWHLFATRDAISGPEVQDNDAALECSQTLVGA